MTYTANARRWAKGWELHIDGVGVTQTRTLANAEQDARDYIASLLDLDESTVSVRVEIDLGDIGDRITTLRKTQRQIDEQRSAAAKEARSIVRELRERHLSVSDIASALGVSRGRVSHLAG